MSCDKQSEKGREYTLLFTDSVTHGFQGTKYHTSSGAQEVIVLEINAKAASFESFLFPDCVASHAKF